MCRKGMASLVAQVIKNPANADVRDAGSVLKCRRPGFDPWAGKIPWRREWQPPPVFLPGESHRQRGAGVLQSTGCQRGLKHCIEVFLLILTTACEVDSLSILIQLFTLCK